MKRVSFKVAKAIKEAGYPQYGHCEEFYDSHGNVVSKMCDMHKLVYPRPTYIEVWLWLWREKKIKTLLSPVFDDDGNDRDKVWIAIEAKEFDEYDDPEEAIIAAIEYLVDNNLIK